MRICLLRSHCIYFQTRKMYLCVTDFPLRKFRNETHSSNTDLNMRKRNANPFVCQGYESPKYFCDREGETKNMLSSLYNGRNITLISPRRLGKTGLIWQGFIIYGQSWLQAKPAARCFMYMRPHTETFKRFS